MSRTLFTDGWSYRQKASAFSELGGAGVGAWTDVVLPHDATIGQSRLTDVPDGAPNGSFPTGAFQYRRTFAVPESHRGSFISLEFEGVYRSAAVYVNGTLAGQRAYGYSEFSVRIDPFLRFGEDNEIMVECRTGKDTRWYSGAGIYRPVHLVVKQPVHVDGGVTITTRSVDDDLAVIEVSASVRNQSMVTSQLRARASIASDGHDEAVASDDAPVTILPGTSATVRHRLLVQQPDLWSPESPALYAGSFRLEDPDGELVDEESAWFGVRTLDVDPIRGLRVNGRSVTLRGACIHHDNGVLGAATFAAAEERRVRILKDAGFNAIRSAHNPASRALLDACDRLGMLVMDEAFDMWTLSKTDEDYSFEFPEWWERDIEAMVVKDINHPSVIFYSIGNEIPETGTSFGGALSRTLAEKVRSLDPTRLVTNGINGFVATLDEVLTAVRGQSASENGGGVNTMMSQLGDMMNTIAMSESVTRRTEESQAVLDVAGMNYAEARYEMDSELFPRRTIVGTESFPTRIDTIWQIVEDNSHVIGDFAWTGWDYLGEAGIGGIDYVEEGVDAQASVARTYPWLVAFSGDIDLTGHRRPASYYREIVYGLRSAPYIAVQRPTHYGKALAFATPWAWSDTVSSWSWKGSEGHPVKVEVYARADEVALLLDAEEIARSTVGTTRRFRAEFDVHYQPGTLEAVAYVAGAETGRHQLTTAGNDLRVHAHITRETSRQSHADLAFVELTLADEQGTTVLDNDRTLSIEVFGDGVLQGFGSARPKTTEKYTGNTHTTFDGRALAVVRITGDAPVTVIVHSDGLADESYDIPTLS